jgi:hypothetical protein
MMLAMAGERACQGTEIPHEHPQPKPSHQVDAGDTRTEPKKTFIATLPQRTWFAAGWRPVVPPPRVASKEQGKSL